MLYRKKRFAAVLLMTVLTFAAAGKAQTAEPTQLLPNQPLEMTTGEDVTHRFPVNASRGDFLRVTVEQKNANVNLKLFDPAGRKIYEVDNSNSREEPERASVIADSSGEFRIEVSFVKKLSGNAPGKDYRITVEALRPAVETDRIRVRAERLYDEANRMRLTSDGDARAGSVKIFQEAAALFARIGDRHGEAFTYHSLGQINSLLSDFEASRTYHAKAAAIFRELDMRPQYARAITDQAAVFYFEHRLDEAERLCLEALEIFEALNDRRGQAEIIGNLGAIQDNKGQPRKALEYYFRALPILQAENDRTQESSILSRIGSVYDDLGEPFPALDYYEKALRIRREIGDERTEAYTLVNMSIVLRDLGQYDRAIENTERALQIFFRIGQKYGQAATLNTLGNLYGNLKDNEKALEYYERALEIIREIKLRDNEAAALSNVATIKLGTGDERTALKLFGESLQIFRELKNRRGEARVLMKLGEAHLKTGNRQEALGFFNQALEIFREVEDRSWEATTLFLIGEANRKAGALQAAKSFYLNALRLTRDLKETTDEPQILLALARAERNLNDPAAAQTRIEEAIKILENTRAQISRPNLRNIYFSANQDFYEFYIDLLYERHRREPRGGFDALAFEASERARARSLLESLGEARFDIRAGVSAETLEKEKFLRQTINAKDMLRLSALNARQKEKAENLEKELEELFRQYSDVQAKIRAESPQFAALVQPETLSLAKFQAEVQDEDSLLLEYSLGEERSFLFIADKESLEIVELPRRAEIETAARRFLEKIKLRQSEIMRQSFQNGPGKTAADGEPWKRERDVLSRMLLGPAAGKLENKRLLIVGSGVLQYVPFAALGRPEADNGFLIETNEVVTLPSASVLKLLRENRRQKKDEAPLLAVMADPVFAADDVRVKAFAGKNKKAADSAAVAANRPLRRLRSDFSRLRFSRREAEEIARFVPDGQKFLAMDFAANIKTAVSDDLKKARLVHFATHGLINSDFPELSGIVFSLVDEEGRPQDGYLRLHDIYNLRLAADLVVLSACDSALGKEIRGEGIIGLTRGFMYAGAPSVVASLWKVEDRATAELMKKFYRLMLKDKRPPAEALRAAQIEMLQDEQWRDPFYWAAFTLQGEWK